MQQIELSFPYWIVNYLAGTQSWQNIFSKVQDTLLGVALPVGFALLATFSAYQIIIYGLQSASHGSQWRSFLLPIVRRLFFIGLLLANYNYVMMFMFGVGFEIDNMTSQVIAENTPVELDFGRKQPSGKIAASDLTFYSALVYETLMTRYVMDPLLACFNGTKPSITGHTAPALGEELSLSWKSVVDFSGWFGRWICSFVIGLIESIIPGLLGFVLSLSAFLPFLYIFSYYFLLVTSLSVACGLGPIFLACAASPGCRSFCRSWIHGIVCLLLFFPVFKVLLAVLCIFLHYIDTSFFGGLVVDRLSVAHNVGNMSYAYILQVALGPMLIMALAVTFMKKSADIAVTLLDPTFFASVASIGQSAAQQAQGDCMRTFKPAVKIIKVIIAIKTLGLGAAIWTYLRSISPIKILGSQKDGEMKANTATSVK